MHSLTYNRAMVSQAEVKRRALGRDRLSTLLALTLTSATLFRFVELPTFSWGVRRLLGSPLGFTVDGTWLLSALMVALIASGTWALLHDESPRADRSPSPVLLIPPSLTALAVSLLLVHASSWPLWLGYLIGSGFLLGGVLTLVARAAHPDSTAGAGARFLLNLVDLFLAFALYTAILAAQERALITAPLIFLLTWLLALDMLRPAGVENGRLFRYAAVLSLLTSEAAWVLGYWPLPPLTASALLTLVFYLVEGMAYQHLLGRLDRRMVMEFVSLGLLFFTLALFIARW